MRTHTAGSPYSLALHHLNIRPLQHSDGLRVQPGLRLNCSRSASFPAAAKMCRHSQLEAHLLSRVQVEADRRMSEAKHLIDELNEARHKLRQVWQERPFSCRLTVSAERNKRGWNTLRGLVRDGSFTSAVTDNEVCLQTAFESLSVDLTSLQAAEDEGWRGAAEMQCTRSEPQHFKCAICFENGWLAKECSVRAGCCGQVYCGLCWATLAKNAVSQSNVQDCLCPTSECRAKHLAAVRKRQRNIAIPEDLLDSLRGLEAFKSEPGDLIEALRALSRLQQNPHTRRCTACGHAQRGDPQAPDMVCGACQTCFCYHHGSEHQDSRCVDYRRRALVADKGAYRFARRMHTKRCPDCLVSIYKDGGCDHMKCSACGRDFNWSQQPVEVPCNCLNLTRQGGDMRTFKVWGHAPCKGASHTAHMKLFAWRCCVVTAAAPVAIPIVVPIVIPIFAGKAALECARGAVDSARTTGRAAQYPQGSFEHTFYRHGNGRGRPPSLRQDTRPHDFAHSASERTEPRVYASMVASFDCTETTLHRAASSYDGADDQWTILEGQRGGEPASPALQDTLARAASAASLQRGLEQLHAIFHSTE